MFTYSEVYNQIKHELNGTELHEDFKIFYMFDGFINNLDHITKYKSGFYR